MNKNHFESNQRYFTICIYTVFVILAACIIFRIFFHWGAVAGAVKNFFSNLSSFILGILIAFIVNPLVNYLYEKIIIKKFHIREGKKSKGAAILAAYIVVLGVFAVCLIYVIPQLISSISDLSAKIPLLYKEFSKWLQNWAESTEFLNHNMINEFINSMYPKIMEISAALASKMIPWLYSASISVIRWLITIVIAVVISVYLLSDKKIIFKTIKKIFYAFLPEGYTDKLVEILKNCNQIFTGYIVAKSLNSLIIGVLCFLLMSILHLPYGVLISVIVGVTDIIPYFGPYIGALPGILILSVIKIKYGVIFAVMIFALQQFDGLFLGPRILGDSTGLRPILILFAITFGGAYMGIIGMFLGVPVMAVLQYLFHLLLCRRLRERGIKIESGEK